VNAEQVLAYIVQRGHVSYDELKRLFGDDMYRVLNALHGKVWQTASGVVSEQQRQQGLLDELWERKLIERELKREEAERRSFNKAPGDPDWEYVK
jgi:hypothetical protein